MRGPGPLVGSLCLGLMVFTVGGGYFLSGVCCRYEFGNVWSPAAMDACCGALFGRGSLLKCLPPPLLTSGLSAKGFV